MQLHLESFGNGRSIESHHGHGTDISEPKVPKYFARKPVYVRCLGGMLLVGFAPVILLSMLLVRLTSPGPALFRQTRLGKDGKRFDVLKIRTMYCDAEDLSGPMLCLPGDSRITPIGKLLRYLHLDELPQLVNVVRGEMCLVGPRPERPEIIAKHKLGEKVPGFNERTKVLPGVTGLAQINLPADQTAECVISKVKLDLEYIATANANLDLRILLCTAMRMVGVRHGRAVRLLGLGRKFDFETNSPASFQTPSVALFRPSGVPLLQFAHASSNGGETASTAHPSSWDESGRESDEAALQEERELASLPHQPR